MSDFNSTQDYLAEQMKVGRVLDWRRVGARLQVQYPHDLSADELDDLRGNIARVEGCAPEFVELLPSVAEGGAE